MVEVEVEVENDVDEPIGKHPIKKFLESLNALEKNQEVQKDLFNYGPCYGLFR